MAETAKMATEVAKQRSLWRLIVVGGHTRSIGKTQLVCDVIRAFPQTEWIAGKVTQYGHGVCARNGENCDCAPTEHVCALDWETRTDTGTDSARFLEAGAKRSFWLRTKQGYLAEGLPLLREALEEVASNEWRVASKSDTTNDEPAPHVLRGLRREKESELRAPLELKSHQSAEQMSKLLEIRGGIKRLGQSEQGVRSRSPNGEGEPKSCALIIESNSLMQFVKPSLYFAVIDPTKDDFKISAQLALDRAHALVMRGEINQEGLPAPLWMKVPEQLMREKPSVLQRKGEALPEPLWALVHRILEGPAGSSV